MKIDVATSFHRGAGGTPALHEWLWRAFLLLFLTLAPLGAQAFWFGDSGNKAAAAEIAAAQLPPEGRATLALIKKGGPFPYARDGIVFGNREGLLPKQPRGYYREYTVPTPGAGNRGARRIIAGGGSGKVGGEYWYTADHYRSFKRIRE